MNQKVLGTDSGASLRTIAVPIVALSVLLGCDVPQKEPTQIPLSVVDEQALATFVTDYMDEKHIPGVAAAVLVNDRVVWSGGWGWADVATQRPMTPETVINIASITKTLTNAAILQLREQERFDLDDPINSYLPFEVEHPRYPEAPITFRHLLTHTAAVEDSEAYDATYACGDPEVALGEWIRGYFTPEGQYYDAEHNFLDSAPGEKYSYSNLGYGLLGYLIEILSGQSLSDYTRRNLLKPLNMDATGWYLTGVELDRHATPYDWAAAGEALDSPLFGDLNGKTLAEDGFVPYCHYSFYNLSDGLLRSSVQDLSRFLLAHMNGGELDGRRVLSAETIEDIFRQQLEPERLDAWEGVQGLTWRQRDLIDGPAWEHSGADPGVRTRMLFSAEERFGVIVFANRTANLRPVVERLVNEARKLPAP